MKEATIMIKLAYDCYYIENENDFHASVKKREWTDYSNRPHHDFRLDGIQISDSEFPTTYPAVYKTYDNPMSSPMVSLIEDKEKIKQIIRECLNSYCKEIRNLENKRDYVAAVLCSLMIKG